MADMKWDLDTWHNTVRGATLEIAGSIPGVGFAVSTVMSFFWPADQASSANIWRKIERQTAVMIDRAILAQEIRNRRADFRTLKQMMAQYAEAKGGNKRDFLILALGKAEDIFTHIEGSKHRIHLIPFAAVTVYLYFVLLRERALFAAELFDPPQRQLWLNNLYDQVKRFHSFFKKTADAWWNWRMYKISSEVKRQDAIVGTFFALVVKDTHGGPASDIRYGEQSVEDPDDVYWRYREMADAIETMMTMRATAQLANALSILWDIRHLMPPNPKRKLPAEVYSELQTLILGPYSSSILGQGPKTANRISRKFAYDVDEPDRPGRVTRVYLREHNIVDALQFLYQGHKGRLAGNPRGGQAHRIKVPKGAQLCSLRCLFKDRFLHSIAFGFSDRSSVGPYGNRTKLRGKTADIRLCSAYALTSAAYRQSTTRYLTGIEVCQFVFTYQPPPKQKTRPKRKKVAA